MKVLAYTSPSRGHLYPIVPILDELSRRGHSIALRTLASEVPLTRQRGFEAAPIAPSIETVEHDDYLARSPQGKIKRAAAIFAARAEHEVPDMRAAIDNEQPDALLVDAMSWGASAVAEAWGGPWAQWFPYPLPLPSPEVPPFGPGLKPAAGPLGRLRDRLLGPLVLGSTARAFLPALNTVRTAVGVRPLDNFAELFTSPPLVLYLTSEPFEYSRSDWPDNIVLVGPCTWEPPAAAPPWLAESTDPLVVVTTSSEFQDDDRLVRVALEGLAGERLRVVATVPASDPAHFEIPPNARVERFLPHGVLLDHAACAVTHGGMGATQKALARGVPVCAVPFGRDQFEVARRVEVAGAGSRLPSRRMTPERLRRKVYEAMGCTEGARRVAAGFIAAGGPTAAADAFEKRAI